MTIDRLGAEFTPKQAAAIMVRKVGSKVTRQLLVKMLEDVDAAGRQWVDETITELDHIVKQQDEFCGQVRAILG